MISHFLFPRVSTCLRDFELRVQVKGEDLTGK